MKPRGPVVVRPGKGHRVGNVEFLATSDATPRFNLALITIGPGKPGPEPHSHESEDDSFYILEGELNFHLEGEDIRATPGTFVLIPPGVRHSFSNQGTSPVRMLNIHAPAGFDRRLAD